MSDELYEAALAHFGVKGMKWGVRKEVTTAGMQKRINSIDKKLARSSGQKDFDGSSYVNWGLQKETQKRLKKDPSFSFDKLTPEQKIAFKKAGVSRAYRTMAVKTTIDMMVFGVGGQMAVLKIARSGQARLGGQIAVGLLAGQVGKAHLHEIASVRTYNRNERLRNERNALEKQIYKSRQ